ncbi:MAG: peptidoglycan DD-metalloendopeptidase family protein [Crocosphaera sp.]
MKGKINEVTAISSCLAEYVREDSSSSPEGCQDKLPSSEKSGVRRSAAMIGLAISMGATGMLLSQDKAAIAANAVTANTAIPSLPNISDAQNQQSTLAPLALKHQVKPGETIAQLAQVYQIEPEAIAAINDLAITAKLEPGESLKIPSANDKDAAEKITPKSSTTSPKNKGVGTKSVNTSLDHLRETRKRLQDSLAELKIEEGKSPVERTITVADVSDVSQPLNPPQEEQEEPVVATPVEVKVAEAIELPVFAPESSEDRIITTQEKETATSVKVSVLEEKESITLPVIPSLKEESTAKGEETEPIPLAVMPSEEETPEVREPVDFTIPEQTSFRKPRPVVPQPAIQAIQKDYRVRPGDTLNSIARRHGISTRELIRANGITNANLIKVNQTLVIPQQGKVATAPRTKLPSVFDSLPSRSNQSSRSFVSTKETPSIDIEISTAQESHQEKLRADIVSLQQDYGQSNQNISLNQPRPSQKTVVGEVLNSEWSSDRQDMTSPQPAIEERLNSSKPELIGAAPSNPTVYNNAFEIPVGTNVGPDLPGVSNPDDYLPDAPMKFTGHIWPSKGVLTSGYGPRWGRMHKGIDIAAPVGTPILASASGEVITAGWNSGGYGNLVKVRHPDGSVTLYAHNSRLLVRRGQKVEQGQQIAEMGSTGYSTGPHLHYEIHPSGRGAQNPMAFLPKSRP